MKPSKVNMDNPSHLRKLDEILEDPNYIAEEKMDGCHYLAIKGRFFSTHIETSDGVPTGFPVEKTENFQHLSDRLAEFGSKLILDGEIYIPGGTSQDATSITGSSPDEAIRKQKEYGFIHYRVFDILRDTDGQWLINKPWHERRRIMEQIAEQLE
jgi:ATP-dependent DNA ligase